MMNTPRKRPRTPAGYTQGRNQRGGLTERQRTALTMVADRKTVGDIAEALGVIKQTASRILQQLVQRQLLVRESPGVYRLTEAGRDWVRAITDAAADGPGPAEHADQPQQQST